MFNQRRELCANTLVPLGAQTFSLDDGLRGVSS
jgi:hypothetical protein